MLQILLQQSQHNLTEIPNEILSIPHAAPQSEGFHVDTDLVLHAAPQSEVIHVDTEIVPHAAPQSEVIHVDSDADPS
jgi:hypothetical protein